MSERAAPAGVFGFVVTHPVAVTMIFVATLVFGSVSYLRLPIELMPDISYPTITVRTVWEGAAPQELEARVSQPVEEALATLDGLVSLESRSRAGTSDVVLGFDWGTDMPAASQAIRENLQTTFLPEGSERPLILRYDPSLDPFLRLALSAEGQSDPNLLARLRAIADLELKRELEGMKGVAAVRVRGGYEREVRVAVREDWLVARGLTLAEVRAALQAENVNIAGGSVLEGDTEYLVRTLNEYATVDELKHVRVRRSDGVAVPLPDVAEIVDGHREREVLSRLDGSEAVELEVFKEADANVVELAGQVRAALFGDGVPKELGGSEGLAATLPEGVELAVLDDQAAFIGAAVANLRSTALLGGALSVGILFLFLRDWRATAIIGLAIPVSVAIGFAPLYLAGVSLNLMSLGGLALGVGMLVDNAVVVLESIQQRVDEGVDRVTASARGTAEVAAAVTASTLTTVAVFAPIAFVEGVAGELFGDLSLAVVTSLMASLAVALLLVPTLAALDVRWVSAPGAVALVAETRGARGLLRAIDGGTLGELRSSFAWIRERPVRRGVAVPYVLLRAALTLAARAVAVPAVVAAAGAGRLAVRLLGGLLYVPRRVAEGSAWAFLAVFERVASLYVRLLGGALRHGGLVVAAALLAFGGAVAVTPWLGAELVPEVHQGRFTIDLSLPVGTPLPTTSRVAAEAEARVMAHPEVRATYATVGSDRRADAAADEGENTARVRVELTPGGDLAAREAAVMEDLRASLEGLGEVKLGRPSLFSTATPIEVVLWGHDLDGLKSTGERAAAALAELPGLVDVRSSLLPGHPEIRVVYDRQRLHRLGLDPSGVAGQVRDKVQGVVATELRQGAERVDLRVQLGESNRDTLDDLRRINVNPRLRPIVPLEAVADFEEAIGPSEIRRVDQQRAVVVSANLAGFDLGSAGSDIEARLETLELGPGTTWRVTGQSAEMEESAGSMVFALGLAIFLVYVIMASTFEHLLHPLVILFSVPLAGVGVAPLLLLSGTPVSVVVGIGAIVLAGVVVNNAIVLVDAINRLRDEGLPLDDAIRTAGRVRLRPILITTATTVLGLLPLSLGVGEGAEIQQPLAIAVIGGLSSSTLLTLLVIPVVYRLAAGLARAPGAAA